MANVVKKTQSTSKPGDSSDAKADKKISKQERSEREEELEVQLKQALADYQNLKREMEKRLEFEGEIVKADLLRSIIGIADDVDIAVDHVEDEKGWREGVTLILEKLRKTIEDMGAEMIDCKPGDSFDAQIHEAVGIVYENGKNGTVATVVQNGYRLNDIVVRPARVIVHKVNSKKNE